MSYYSVHMDHPIIGGYRRSELRPTTVAELTRLSWQKLRRPDVYLNGNTKWQEMPIVAFFFRNGFINKAANIDIGYAYDKSERIGSNGLNYRLSRVNTQELLSFGIKLMMSGLLKKDWAWILDPNRTKSKGRNGGGQFSKQRIRFSKVIVNQAIDKYGLKQVCWKLRVEMKVIRFWLDYNN